MSNSGLPPQQPRRRLRIDLVEILRSVILILLAIVFLFPFYLIARNALMTQAEITSFEWSWWPAAPQWENVGVLFNDPAAPMGSGMRNSLFIALFNLVFQTLFASMAGYALARIPAVGRSLVFFINL